MYKSEMQSLRPSTEASFNCVTAHIWWDTMSPQTAINPLTTVQRKWVGSLNKCGNNKYRAKGNTNIVHSAHQPVTGMSNSWWKATTSHFLVLTFCSSCNNYLVLICTSCVQIVIMIWLQWEPKYMFWKTAQCLKCLLSFHNNIIDWFDWYESHVIYRKECLPEKHELGILFLRTSVIGLWLC